MLLSHYSPWSSGIPLSVTEIPQDTSGRLLASHVAVVEAWRLVLTRIYRYVTFKALLQPIVMQLHGRNNFAFILIPETADLLAL